MQQEQTIYLFITDFDEKQELAKIQGTNFVSMRYDSDTISVFKLDDYTLLDYAKSWLITEQEYNDRVKELFTKFGI